MEKPGQRTSGRKSAEPLTAPVPKGFGRIRRVRGNGRRKYPAIRRHAAPGVPPTGDGRTTAPVTIRTSPVAPASPRRPRHCCRCSRRVHARPAYETRSMRSAEELATAQCASSQPRRGSPPAPPRFAGRSRSPCARRRRRRGGRRGATAVEAAGGRGRRPPRPGLLDASRPKSRTSAARTASGPRPVCRTALAGQGGGRAPGQGRGQQRGVRLVLRVRLREAAALHPLRRDGERQFRVVRHLVQVLVELARRVRRVQDLLLGAPALRGPLLEQAQ